MKKNKQWKDYLWIVSSIYLILGLFNILFAWLGLFCFFIPLLVSIFGKGKAYCNSYCGRGQLMKKIGKDLKWSRNKRLPEIIRTRWFRLAFLTFFMIMFGLMIFSTVKVFQGSSLKQVVTLLWSFKVPWHFAYHNNSQPWIAQFAFGFYSVMLTSSVLGLITTIFYQPRSWCVYCPMGTMTQLLSEARVKIKE